MADVQPIISGTITIKSPRLEGLFEERGESFADFVVSIQEYLDNFIAVSNQAIATMHPVGFVAGETSTFETKFASSGVELCLQLSVVNTYHGDFFDIANCMDLLSAIMLRIFTLMDDPFGDEERLITQLIDQIIEARPELPESVKRELSDRLRDTSLENLQRYVDDPETFVVHVIDDESSQMVSSQGSGGQFAFDEYMN